MRHHSEARLPAREESSAGERVCVLDLLLSRGSCKVPYTGRECVVTVCTLILPDKIPVKQNTCAGSASNRASERASMHTRLHSVNSKPTLVRANQKEIMFDFQQKPEVTSSTCNLFFFFFFFFFVGPQALVCAATGPDPAVLRARVLQRREGRAEEGATEGLHKHPQRGGGQEGAREEADI